MIDSGNDRPPHWKSGLNSELTSTLFAMKFDAVSNLFEVNATKSPSRMFNWFIQTPLRDAYLATLLQKELKSQTTVKLTFNRLKMINN
ncbi:hypothetical protein [Roseobacter sp.]|uniref:hypothetical protein n=1 Tax=Roseobacter sp. TaxID=1907202 RepID=UPI00385B3D84